MPTRRRFLTASISALTLFSAPSLRAEILTGPSAKMHGQRDRALWLAAQQLKGARLAKPGDQIQAVFFIDLNCPACAELWKWFDTPERRRWATLWIPVAYMNKSSEGRAIALLRASDPYAALAKNFGSGFNRKARQGALESPRVLRRLQILREWSHEQIKQIFPRSQIARSPYGAGTPR